MAPGVFERLPGAWTRRAAMARIRKQDSTLCSSTLKLLVSVRRPEDFGRWAQGLRLVSARCP
jgi:hypothetical protein